MSVSYTLNGHYMWRIGDDLNIPLITVRAVIERYLELELLAAGVKDYTTSVIHHGGDKPVLRDVVKSDEAPEPNKPSDIEVIAERLAKVEDRLDKGGPMIGRDIVELRQRLDKVEHAFVQNVVDSQHYKMLSERIDKVAEIIGERISGLVDEIAAVQDLLGEKSRSPGALYYASRIAQLADAVRELNPGWRGWKGTDGPAFPTGGAHTLEGATDAVLPVPQRGDRVRLEGARSNFGTRIEDGWWDVHGQLGAEFQIGRDDGLRVASPLYWVAVDSPGIKEVRHADHN